MDLEMECIARVVRNEMGCPNYRGTTAVLCNPGIGRPKWTENISQAAPKVPRLR